MPPSQPTRAAKKNLRRSQIRKDRRKKKEEERKEREEREGEPSLESRQMDVVLEFANNMKEILAKSPPSRGKYVAIFGDDVLASFDTQQEAFDYVEDSRVCMSIAYVQN